MHPAPYTLHPKRGAAVERYTTLVGAVQRQLSGLALYPVAGFWVNLLSCGREREFFIDNLLLRIHFTIDMILVDRPCAMGV